MRTCKVAGVFIGALAASGCVGSSGTEPGGSPGAGSTTGNATGNGGQTGTGVGGAVGVGGAGSTTVTGVGGSSVTGVGGAGAAGTTGAAGAPLVQCNTIAPGRAPVRRLTTYEYNNTVRDLLGDTTNPGGGLPAQVDSKDNPFGNDADEQSPSPLLIEKYQSIVSLFEEGESRQIDRRSVSDVE